MLSMWTQIWKHQGLFGNKFQINNSDSLFLSVFPKPGALPEGHLQDMMLPYRFLLRFSSSLAVSHEAVCPSGKA